ncbi:MAG TPA: phosphoglycerate mutase family protein [Chryseolinea sp.]|nr:phosphoglycerate mutase family protein [Chryseolinea sp.]
MNESSTWRNKIGLVGLWLACFLCVAALQGEAQQITTFILVRHAEKVMDKSKDPVLTEQGNARARRLQALLEKVSIDAIYTTPYKRTRTTVEPLAQARGLALREYEPEKEAAIDEILLQHAGKTILVSGHSNTIPEIANWLTGSKQYSEFDDTDYGNLMIVSVVQKGSVATVTWLRY